MKRITATPVLLAAGLAVAVVVWMASGLLGDRAPVGAEAGARSEARRATAPRVAVLRSHAREVTREIVVSGRTEPNREVELRAETEGRVVALGAERGSAVAAGERIVGIDLRDREARLEEARAVLAHAELQLQAARRLQNESFISETQIAEAYARISSARTALATTELEIANSTIKAPFDGMLQERLVELGDYLSSGDSVARIVDVDPLLVVGEVSETEINELARDGTGTAVLVGGVRAEGTIRYLSPVADQNTRTFRVELAVPNPRGELRAGMTAEMRLAADRITAHVLSPALLALDDTGVIGVKSVDERNRVQFLAVEIVSSSTDGVFVTGLPETVDLITIGQGFVSTGQLVEPIPAAASEGALAPPAGASYTHPASPGGGADERPD